MPEARYIEGSSKITFGNFLADGENSACGKTYREELKIILWIISYRGEYSAYGKRYRREFKIVL